jgi:hypothetical protein
MEISVITTSETLQTIRQTPVVESDKHRLAFPPVYLILLIIKPERHAVDRRKGGGDTRRGWCRNV